MIQFARLVNTQFTSNTYILSKEDEKAVWLVDPGDIQHVWQWMQAHGKSEVLGVLLTHGHFDHLFFV